MPEEKRNEVCILEFANIKERIEKIEEKESKRDDDLKVIEKAIVAIQVANEQTAETLTKMDKKMDLIEANKSVMFWSEDTKKNVFKYATIIIVVVILALVGTNMIEGMQAIQGIK